jgi:hypothetical protein
VAPPPTAIPFGRLDIPEIVQLELAQRVHGLTVQFHAFMQVQSDGKRWLPSINLKLRGVGTPAHG